MSTLFKEYYARLAKEGWLKSLLAALLVGFSVLIVSAIVFLIASIKPFWLCIIIWAVAVAGFTPLFYFKKYRPDKKAIAKRIDELGLEERILTMNQLDGDTSYIAQKQREDAMKALSAVNPKLIKIAVSVPLVIATSICAVAGIGATTYTALAESGKVKNLEEIRESLEEDVYYEVCYEAGEGGIIIGEPFQLVKEGEDATPVSVAAEDGWVFVGWSDDVTDAYREDLEVYDHIMVTAEFMEAEGDAKLESGDSSEEEEGDQSEEASGGGVGDQGDESSASGGGGGSDGQGGGAGGKYEENNMVVDGETYFGDNVYDEAYESEMSDAMTDGEISDDLRDIIEDYFGTIER